MTARLAPWFDDPDNRKRALIERALMDVGICEDAGKPNRGKEIDAYLRLAGVPETVILAGQGYWCASALFAWFIESGCADLAPPKSMGPASCDAWMKFAKDTGRFSTTIVPAPCVVLYGVPGDAQHIGLVIRTTPILYGVEGNTTAGGSYNRDGVAVDARGVNLPRVLGYYNPFAPKKVRP